MTYYFYSVPVPPTYENGPYTYTTVGVTNETAQHQFQASARLFVGNLPSNLPFHLIFEGLKDIFLPFGQCWIDIGYWDRSQHQPRHPVAFIQYQNIGDAWNARQSAENHPRRVGDRLIRVEHSQRGLAALQSGCCPYGVGPNYWREQPWWPNYQEESEKSPGPEN